MHHESRIRRLLVAAAGVLLASALAAQSRTDARVASDDEIRKILVDRVDVQRQSVGIVVGVVEPKGRRVIAYGRASRSDERPLDGDTVFEIGSITKVFTALLLADTVERGDASLTDPVAKHLRAGDRAPSRGGRAITLQDLAQHTSGLPRLPGNLAPKDRANPYADYSVEQLNNFLARYQLTRDPGALYEYSNLGGGLLGHALALRAAMDYETLVRTRITGPLGMKSTSITLTPDQQKRLADGHNAGLQRVANWDIPALAGAGALRSTANDMLTFVAAAMGGSSPLAKSFAALTATRRPTGMNGLDIALGWHIVIEHGKEVVWHNGGTGGYRTWVGYDPRARVGVVVLSNTNTPAGPDDIGRHLLDSEVPLLRR